MEKSSNEIIFPNPENGIFYIFLSQMRINIKNIDNKIVSSITLPFGVNFIIDTYVISKTVVGLNASMRAFNNSEGDWMIFIFKLRDQIESLHLHEQVIII